MSTSALETAIEKEIRTKCHIFEAISMWCSEHVFGFVYATVAHRRMGRRGRKRERTDARNRLTATSPPLPPPPLSGRPNPISRKILYPAGVCVSKKTLSCLLWGT